MAKKGGILHMVSILQPLAMGSRYWQSKSSSTSRKDATTQWVVELFILLALLNLVALATVGPQRLAAISPHPYWIPVILMSCQHGTLAGVAAAISAMAIHWLGGAPVPAGGEDLYDYLHRVWREPMLWLVAAVVIGGLRSQQAHRLHDMRLRLSAADDRLAAIGTYANDLRSHCEALERHIACAADRSIEAGLGALDEISSSSYEALGSALPRAMDLLVGPSSYTLLTLQDGRLAIESELSRSMPDASRLPRIEQLPDELAAELARHRRILTVRSDADLDVLGGVSLLAVPVIAGHGEKLIGVLLVQTLDPTRLHAATERSLKHLAQQLAYPLGRQRVVVSFQRDRHVQRVQQTAEETTVIDHPRVTGSPAQEVRKSGPE